MILSIQFWFFPLLDSQSNLVAIVVVVVIKMFYEEKGLIYTYVPKLSLVYITYKIFLIDQTIDLWKIVLTFVPIFSDWKDHCIVVLVLYSIKIPCSVGTCTFHKNSSWTGFIGDSCSYLIWANCNFTQSVFRWNKFISSSPLLKHPGHFLFHPWLNYEMTISLYLQKQDKWPFVFHPLTYFTFFGFRILTGNYDATSPVADYCICFLPSAATAHRWMLIVDSNTTCSCYRV